MSYLISYICVSHTGLLRQTNQDNFLCGRHHLPAEHSGTAKPLRGALSTGKQAVFGIFDGIGGGYMGEVASWLAAKAASLIQPGARPLEALLEFSRQANRSIRAHSDHAGTGTMGTTATVAAFSHTHIHLCHLGDSRAYRFREGQLTQLTRDQVLEGCSGGKPPLTEFLGIGREPEPFLAEAPLQPEDIYLLCSDGLTDMLTAAEISKILSAVPFHSAAEHLLNTALCRGGRDNITLILCKTQVSARKPMCIKRLFPGGTV